MVRIAAAALLTLVTAFQISARGSEITLLDFNSPHCPPCREMDPVIDGLVRAGYPIRKIDVTQDRQAAIQYNVPRVPCFVMLAGGQEVDRVIGATSQDRLVGMFRRAQEVERQNAERIRAQSPDSLAAVQSTMAADTAAPPTAGGPTGLTNLDRSLPAAPATMIGAPLAMPGAPASRADSSSPANLIRATVRLRVEDSTGRGFGTGTIIDARSGEALIITCGHLFRASEGKGPITVELFEDTPAGPRAVAEVPGQVVRYDVHREIGFVSIRPGRPVGIAPVAPAGIRIERGDRVVSVGCSHGEDPTVLESRINSLDRYQGPANLQASGAPVEGRSGGGLFNDQGQLIGICFAADYEGNEGLYAALESIHEKLDSIGLTEIYAADAVAADGAVPGQFAAAGTVVRGQEPLQPVLPVPAKPLSVTPIASAAPVAVPGAGQGLNPVEEATLEELTRRAAESEVICIIRPKVPGGQSEVIVLDGVSPEFIRGLAQPPRDGVAAPLLR